MEQLSEFFASVREPFAFGFYEDESAPRMYRFANAYYRFFEAVDLPDYDGGPLYPCGVKYRSAYAVSPDFAQSASVNMERIKAKNNGEPIPELFRDLTYIRCKPPHTVGGNTYTHAIPNFCRVEREGLDAYRNRVLACKDEVFRDSMLRTLDGIACYHRRCIAYLEEQNGDPVLLDALRKVPFQPAETLYEAVVCRNFMYYIDGCDNPGRLDADWFPFYRGENMESVFAAFFDNVDANSGWSSALGPDYNELTLQILRAIRGKRRPSLELRVTPDMPDEIWEASADALRTGCGQPAFYNETLYQKGLAERFPHLSAADRLQFNGGGCTETMLAGISHVGSLDAGINTALVFSELLPQLPQFDRFEDFYDTLHAELCHVTQSVLDQVCVSYRDRAEKICQPIRTLLMDDCIDRELDFNCGGARANWSVINFAGMINVIDSLLAIRDLVYTRHTYTAEQFLSLLTAEDPTFYAKVKQCPCFGVDNEQADLLASDFMQKLFSTLDGRKPPFGDAFLPSSIQFATYDTAGLHVPATPDGRKDRTPLCDSVGPLNGKAVGGPTAMLNSVSRLPLRKALGTPVLNLRLQKKALDRTLKPLVSAFFAQGGMQVQISCMDAAALRDAMEHPEKHEDLIVRIGGYSEYFNRLSPALKQSVLERTEME